MQRNIILQTLLQFFLTRDVAFYLDKIKFGKNKE